MRKPTTSVYAVVVALSFFGCGEVVQESNDGSTNDAAATPDAAPGADAVVSSTCTTATGLHKVYLNTNGGMYTMGAVTSPRDNVSSIIQSSGQVAGWQVSGAVTAEMIQCLGEVFAPFNVLITDSEPTQEPYHEIVITSDPSDAALFQFQVPSIGQLGCTPLTTSISFVFTNFSDNPLTVCQSASSMIGFTQGLSRVVPVCEDAMTATFECNEQVDFFDGDQTCGQAAAMPCNCNMALAVQNSHQTMLGNLGPCP